MKAVLKTTLKKIGCSLFVAALAVLWTTCEVGLGEAVDTMAPTVSVTKPAQSAVCAGPVEISGTCGDDKGIASINIVVTNTGTGEKFNCQGKVSELTKWSVTINQLANGAYPLKDGSYTADVTAIDIYGRSSGTSSTAFGIDNTAPVFCVTSPASLDITNPRKYGRSVTISGEIADDHDIAKMNIRVFRVENGATTEITSALAKTEFKDFETAGGTTVYVAKYFDQAPSANNNDGSENPDYALYKNYMAIYGNFALGTNVLIYAVPTLTDVAGNTSQVCYLSSEVKNLAAKLCGVEATIDSLQTAQLMKVYNGTYTGEELNDEQKGKIISLLNGTYELQPGDAAYYSRYDDSDDAKRSPLAACVNSDNSPKYAFSGYELASASPSSTALKWSEVNTGGTLSVSVQAGLDDWGVLPSELEVCLLKCDENGNPYPESDTANYKKFVSNQSQDFTITNALGESIKDISTSVTAQSYYVTLPKMSSSECYLLTASGKDEDGNSLTPAADKYGLKVASTGAKPKVEFEDRYFIKGSRMIAGASDAASVVLKITDATDTINDGKKNPDDTLKHFVEVQRALYKGHIASKGYLGNYTYEKSATDTFTTTIDKLGTNEYTLTVPLDKYSLDSTKSNYLEPEHYTLALNVTAKNDVAEADATFILWIDNKKPQIVISAPAASEKVFDNNANITKEAQSDGSYKYYYAPNGKWSDKEGSGTSALWYSTEDTGSAAPTISGNATDGWTITGNARPAPGTGNFEWRRIDAVQADTETSWSTNWAGLDAQGNKKPVTDSTGNFIKMIAVDAVGNISDVVGASDITFNFNPPKVALTSEPYTSATSPAAMREYYNAAAPADTTSGKLTFVFTATHNLALEEKDLTATPPKTPITVTAKKNGATAGSGYAVDVTFAKDASGNDDHTKAIATVTLAADGSADGEWSFDVFATDADGKEGEKLTFKTILDRQKPALDNSIVIKEAGTTADWYKDETLSVKGKWTEAASGSGIARIYYWLGTPTMQQQSGYSVPADLTTAEGSGYIDIPAGANTGTDVAYTITPTGFEEKQVVTPQGSSSPVEYFNNLYIQAVDKAGNKTSVIGAFQIKEDKTAPEFETKYYVYEGGEPHKAEGVLRTNGTKKVTLYGDISDPLSGLNEFKFRIGGADLAATILYSTETCSTADQYQAATYYNFSLLDPTAIKSWKADIAAASLVTGELFANASDVAGNPTGYQRSFNIVVDNEPPSIKLTSPNTIKDGETGTAASIYGKSVTFRGTASDGSDLASVTVWYSTDNNTWNKLAETITDSTMYNWNVTATGAKAISAASGSSYTMLGYNDLYNGTTKDLYIKVEAVDKADNTANAVYKYSIAPELDRPKIKIFEALNTMTSADADYIWIKNSNKITGSVSDENGVESLAATFELYNQNADSGNGAWIALTDSTTPKAPTLTLSNGSFTIKDLPDGKLRATFAVTDKAGTTFTAGSASSYTAPIVYGNDSTPKMFGKDSDDTLIYVKVDNQPPRAQPAQYSYNSSGSWQDTLPVLGGARQTLDIQIKAYDEFGIGSVVFSMEGISKSGTAGSADSEGYALYTITGVDMTSVASGTWPAKITITDNAGLSVTNDYNITVDNTAPVITFTAPTNTATKPIVGETTVIGSVNESSTMHYGLSKNNTDEPAQWHPIDSSLAWNVYFDGDASALNHDKLLKDYLIETAKGGLGITTETEIENGDYADDTPLWIWAKAVDEVGNESIEKFEITVDPQGDKPTVDIKGPSASGTTVGGKFRLYGGANDNKEVKAVFVQIISKNHIDKYEPASKNYGNCFDSDGKLTSFTLAKDDLNYLKAIKDSAGNPVYKIYKMATYDPGDSATWTVWPDSPAVTDNPNDYGVLADLSTGGKSWSLYINEKSEFSKAGDDGKANSIAIRAYAIDALKTKGTGASAVTKANVSIALPANDRQMFINENAPVISDLYVRTYSETVSFNAAYASSKPYIEDMFVKGQTWLRLVVKDDNGQEDDEGNITTLGVASLNIGLDKGRAADAAAHPTSVTLPTSKGNDGATGSESAGILCKRISAKEVEVLVKLDTGSNVGTQYIYVDCTSASDNNPITTKENYTIKFDNTPPQIAGVAEKDYYNINPKVQQSNGWYDFGSKVSEPFLGGASNQSGFGRVAFYFMRRDTANGKTYIYDPMIKKGVSQNKITVGSALKYSEGLYWKTINVSSRSGNALTLSDADKNIHVYGLVKVNGSIYRIESVIGSVVTVEVEGGVLEGTVTSADFAIGNVVDHQIKETHYDSDDFSDVYAYGYKSTSSDDGDKMIETVSQSGTDWTWSASIYSKNIPDGPIELHYVAFDAAGNYTKGIMGCVDEDTYKSYGTKDAVDAAKTNPDVPDAPVSVYAYAQTSGSTLYSKDAAAFVSNNAPRLTNLYAGTDLNGNGNVDEVEMAYRVYTTSLSGWENATSSIELVTQKVDGGPKEAAFTAKGKTIIRPEIIGGNGDLYYSYKISGKDKDDKAYTISGRNETIFMKGSDTAGHTTDDTAREDQTSAATADITLHVGDFYHLEHDLGSANTDNGILDCEADKPVAIEFTFWDSTELRTKFVDSQTATAAVYMAVDVRGEKLPSINIDPLYWNDLTDNSTYNASAASSYAELKGHIELPDDLPADTFGGSGEWDKDPKLSGKIVLTGTVNDSKMISKVYMAIKGMTLGTATKAFTDGDGNSINAYRMAAYTPASGTTPASWTTDDYTLDANGFTFAITDGGITKDDGHTATWTLTWDTSYISGIADTDVNINVFAISKNSTASKPETGATEAGIEGVKKYAAPEAADNKTSAASSTATSETKKTPYYKVDVVPYITGLKTTMTEKGLAYGRTSTGRYPVYFYKNSTTGAMATGDTEGKGAGFVVNGFNLAAKNVSVTRTVGDSGADITASGELVITVNNVKSLNNKNNNDARGSYDKTVSVWTKNTNTAFTTWKNYPNRQPSKENNLLLTDDVYVDVWQINNKAVVPVRGIANDVTMKINQESKMLNFAFVDGPLNFGMANGQNNSYQTWARSYDFCKSATLAVDDGGNSYGTIAGGDTGEDYADAFGFYTSKWGTGYFGTDESKTETTHGTQTGTNQNRLESVGQKGSKSMTITNGVYTNNNSGTDYQTDQWRFVSPCIATTYSSNGKTNAYMAYYDQMNDEIRFRAGKTVPATRGDFGNFVDTGDHGGAGNNYKDQVYTFDSINVQIVAQENTPKKPGPYVSIAASNKSGSDVVVMVWHDPIVRKMWYCFNEDPTTSRANTINDQTGRTGTDGKRVHGWSAPVEVFSGVTGEHCQVAFDKDGKVHIAAYDSGSNDLWYAYLSDYANPSGAVTCLVDSYNSVGTRITLDVAHTAAGAPIPYIGYLVGGKTPKLAYYRGTKAINSSGATADDIMGASGDYFTGNWEATVVPTITEGIQGEKDTFYDRVNVGVWKNAGVITDSKNKEGSVGISYYDNSGSERNANSKGYVYGNGTSNPVLAYRYEVGADGYVETAQKK